MEQLFSPFPSTHTSSGDRGLLDLPCIKTQLLMDAKLFSGTTKCQKDIVSENTTVWIT